MRILFKRQTEDYKVTTSEVADACFKGFYSKSAACWQEPPVDNEVVLDGELVLKDCGLSDSEAFQKGTGIANSKNETKEELEYVIFDTMSKKGYLKDVLENIEGYFYNMAVLSNTLWEMDSTKASLNHGFASHVAVWLLQEMNERQK